MNVYRNKRTGAEVITASTVTGGDWELVKPAKKPAKDNKNAGNDNATGGEGK